MDKLLNSQEKIEKNIIGAKEKGNLRKKKIFRNFAICFTILYAILFPFFLMLGGLSFMVFGAPRITYAIGITIISLMFCIPISIPVTISMLWIRYSHKKYNNPFVFCMIPVFTFIFISFTVECLAPVK